MSSAYNCSSFNNKITLLIFSVPRLIIPLFNYKFKTNIMKWKSLFDFESQFTDTFGLQAMSVLIYLKKSEILGLYISILVCRDDKGYLDRSFA